jgi:predicted SnoaL-like aldol condensation-catalyzing enzyme
MNAVLGVILFLFVSQPTRPAATAEDVVRKLYADFNTHSADALVANVAENILWMTIADDKIAMEASGREPLTASMTRYFKSTPTVQSTIESLMAAGDFVTVHERVRWRVNGAEKTQSAVAVYKIKESKVAAVWYYDVMP